MAFISQICLLQIAPTEAQLPLRAWPFAGTSDDFMQRLARLPLTHQPGERWLYQMVRTAIERTRQVTIEQLNSAMNTAEGPDGFEGLNYRRRPQ